MRVFETGIYRPNLELAVEHVSGDAEKQAELLELLEKGDGVGIIYTATVRHVEELTRFLAGEGFDVLGYHGRLAAKRRKEVQERFMAGELKAIVATNAFGMGIDKSDIRFVVHYDLPGSLEAYYQEAGRAGRDGEAARCVLFYDSRDRRTQIFLLGGRYPSLPELTRVYQTLASLGEAGGPVSSSALQQAAAPVAKTKCRVAISMLKESGFVREPRIGRFSLVRRMRPHQLSELASEWTRKAERDRDKLDRMEAYARSALCRWKVLRDYFGDEGDQGRCGVCDNCRRGLAERAEDLAHTELPPSDSPESISGQEPDPEPTFRVGDRVSLPKSGSGTIEAIEGDTLLVRFAGGRARKFKREFAHPVRTSKKVSD
jgi:ATP-dependent DNA helicase RecQ